MQKILVCDDDKQIVEAIDIYLTGEGFQVIKAYDGLEALELLKTNEVNLMIVDVMMPGLDGIRTTLKVRETSSIPIIILSAKSEDSDKILGLNIGADDYITKPFSLSVLRARVNTQLRKAAAMSEKEKDNEHVYRKEPYVFDFDRMKFMVDGKETELSKTEQKLLRILVENAGMNMRRELLLDRVWSDGAEYVDENALSVSVKRLRDKLGAEHAIRTVYGIGYRWE